MHNNTRALFVCERECYAHILHTLFSLWAHVPQIHRTSTCAQQCLDFMNPSTQNLTPQFHPASKLTLIECSSIEAHVHGHERHSYGRKHSCAYVHAAAAALRRASY
eukprot:1158684-Pelagomonas_calceolata.AAC.2